MKNLLGALLVLYFLRGSSSVYGIQICATVAVLKSADNLCKNFPNKVLVNRVPLLQTATNNLLKVSTLTIFHYDVDFQVLFVNKAVVILHYMWVLKFAQNVYFSNNLRLLFLIHFAIVKFFPHQNLAITFSLYLAH